MDSYYERMCKGVRPFLRPRADFSWGRAELLSADKSRERQRRDSERALTPASSARLWRRPAAERCWSSSAFPLSPSFHLFLPLSLGSPPSLLPPSPLHEAGLHQRPPQGVLPLAEPDHMVRVGCPPPLSAQRSGCSHEITPQPEWEREKRRAHNGHG